MFKFGKKKCLKDYKELEKKVLNSNKMTQEDIDAALKEILGERVYMLIKKDHDGNLKYHPDFGYEGWLVPHDIPSDMRIIQISENLVKPWGYKKCEKCGLYFDYDIELKDCLCGYELPEE